MKTLLSEGYLKWKMKERHVVTSYTFMKGIISEAETKSCVFPMELPHRLS